MNRQSYQERKTKESTIEISVNLDGSGIAKINTGIGFFDHMLNHITIHGTFDIEIKVVKSIIKCVNYV